MAGLSIRKACPADAALLVQLVGEMAVYERAESALEITEERVLEYFFVERPLAEAWLAYLRGEVAGYIIAYVCLTSFRCRPVLYLEDLFVRAHARRRGLGRQLMQFVIDLALERRCHMLAWSVLDWNEPAIRFYRKLGAQQDTGRLEFSLREKDLLRLSRRGSGEVELEVDVK